MSAGRESLPGRRADRATAAWLGVGALALYLVTLCPTIFVEDSAEFSTAAAVLGVPHPPGYPLYTMLAGAFVRLVPLGDAGYRSNLFSAACGALAVVALWVLLRRLAIGRLAALAAAICFAVGQTFWSQGLAAEVHTLNALLLVGALLAVHAAAERPATGAFAATGLLVGLLVGHRNLNALLVLGFPLELELARRRAGAPRRLWLWALGAGLGTAAVYLYLPLAAGRHPPLDMGAPTTWRRFLTVVSARPYFRHLGAGSPGLDLLRLAACVRRLPWELGIAALAAPFGVAFAWHRWPRARFWSLAWIAVACCGFSAAYNVLDVASYFLPAILVLAIFAALAFDDGRARPKLLLVALALVLLPLNFGRVSLRGLTAAEVYGRDLLRSAPPNALLVSFGDTTTHTLAYAQAVEHQRPDVAVVSIDEIAGWSVEELAARHPALRWPALGDAPMAWLNALVDENRPSVPVCATEPVGLGSGTDWRPHAAGLLFCLGRAETAADLDAALAFWQATTTPDPRTLAHADVHVQMIAFAYALSRFELGTELVTAGRLDEARAQFAAVAASGADQPAAAVREAMATIGRRQRGAFELARRAEGALRAPLVPGPAAGAGR